ncbi:helix-turn-helix domain-containing protein [Roseibacterium beibuensis]|uniref:helix-turn-helix domain-containing protein n=1 Tax=[Roseibacterium] beibuensis TaxID=1193142 RepID=UPI00217D0CF5|nr:helix-turn-helix domain-containing protein [Roseibacterium beibuensis]MCS6627309.1 helix-turn-helix domain-containing protein [Roseibacterium beibuensis]
MKIVHDTAVLPADQQFAFYREVLCSDFKKLRAERDADGPYRARIVYETFGRVVAIRTSLPRHRVVRDSREMARTSQEHLFVHMLRGGGIEHDHRGVPDRAAAGQMVLSDSTRSLHAVIPDRLETVTLALPRAELLARAPAFQERIGVAVDLGHGAAALLRAFVRAATRHSAELEGTARDRVGDQLCDLLAAAYGAGGDDRPRSLPDARREAILAHIDAHLSDPRLGADSVATRFGLSPRYVGKLFEAGGVTLGETVTAKRIGAAGAVLGDPMARGRTIAEIAYACGFSDLTTFNRRFRQAFGATPRDYRAAALRSA